MAMHLLCYTKRVMKQMFLCAGIFLLISTAAQSQQTKSKSKIKKATHAKTASAKETASNSNNSPSTVTLNTTGSYSAKTNATALPSLNNNYMITDPILATLNARANGANIQFNKSGIVGMPKRAYGFANGHITLATTGAVTSGTQTGSGAVSTGSSLATFGSIGAPMNVNGKSSYAGINMWGNAMNMEILRTDSSMRFTPAK